MSFSFTKRYQETEYYSIEFILEGEYTKTFYSSCVEGVNNVIDCMTVKYPEHNKTFYVQRVIDYKPIKIKGEIL